jgi:quercetin dioxygenase-like cupin family protein
MDKHSVAEKFSRFSEHWRPKVIAELNGQEVKAVKAKGVFPWHVHNEADEMFLVWKGTFRVEFRDRAVDLAPGDYLVVPRGTEHRTIAADEAEVLVFESAETMNTGDVRDQTFTAPNGVRI